MNDSVHAFECGCQALAIPNITNEKSQARISVFLSHVELLQFVARVDHDALHLRVLKKAFDALMAEGTGAAGDEDGLRFEHDDVWESSALRSMQCFPILVL